MSTSSSQPELPAADDLVAYLDGELPPDGCRLVERRLSDDADYRRELGELDQAWSALEALPRATVGDNFARTTIEMVTVNAERDLTERSAATTANRRRHILLAAAACAAMAVAAFGVVRVFAPNPNDVLLSDLPVIAQVDVLAQIDDVDFLRRLSSLGIEQLLGEGEAPVRRTAQETALTQWATREGRRAWIDGLSADQKDELAAKLSRFQQLAARPAAQDRLRQLEQEISQAADSAKLQATLATYDRWLNSRTPGERQELLDLATSDARLRTVEKWARQESRVAGRQLSLEDERALQDAILEFVKEHQQELQQELRRQGNAEPQQHIAARSTAMVAMGIFWREMGDNERRQKFQERLTARLSDDAQKYLESLPGGVRGWQLRRWMRDAIQPKFGPQELERFFAEDLTNDQREELLNLPQPMMEERLEQMYVGSQLGLQGREWFGGFGPGGFGPGGPELGRPPRGPEAGPRGRRDGLRRDFEAGRPERGRFNRGPDGPPPDGPPPDGPPPNGPPPNGRLRNWRNGPPPPPPREPGPPPNDGPPQDGSS